MVRRYAARISVRWALINTNARTVLYNDDLTVDEIVEIINNLPTLDEPGTLTIGTTNLAKLTDDQIAIATNKGWTLA